MEDFVKIFKSPQGDVYHITLSESNDILSKSVLEALGDVHIAGVDLRRLEGSHACQGTGTWQLHPAGIFSYRSFLWRREKEPKRHHPPKALPQGVH